MRKENSVVANVEWPTARTTRARAGLYRSSGAMVPPKASAEENRTQCLRVNPKRAARDERKTLAPITGCRQSKRRAVLKDVTNVCCDIGHKIFIDAPQTQNKNSKQTRRGSAKTTKEILSAKGPKLQANRKPRTQKTGQAEVELSMGNKIIEWPEAQLQAERRTYEMLSHRRSLSNEGPDIRNIDSEDKDPQLCSLYAPDIYSNIRVLELIRRPCPNFMETVQKDITQAMRGILIDWLVEVSEEYKLVPDTLYLSVSLIDWFLSQNYIERHRLQLLGITCMLIASKYEEICAPRVEEFCFITDNSYTKEEVLQMEIHICKYIGFHIHAPTAKTFLRRFLIAAQVLYEGPSAELEFLANYLTELSLIDYGFLNHLPSLVAASAVYLARWTLDQSDHPWNPTLEHYTMYKASDLKNTVLALQGLQLNTKGCPLNAIRAKYRQEKFQSVAVLSSPKLLESLF